MAERRARYDKYGRPLPMPVPAGRQSLADTDANREQRAHILRRLQAKLDEHYPHLLRADVNARVTVSFRIVRGTIQRHARIGIVWEYEQDEE